MHYVERPGRKTQRRNLVPEARLSAVPLAGSREWTLTLASERRMLAVRLWTVVQVLSSIALAIA